MVNPSRERASVRCRGKKALGVRSEGPNTVAEGRSKHGEVGYMFNGVMMVGLVLFVDFINARRLCDFEKPNIRCSCQKRLLIDIVQLTKYH